MLKTLLPGRCFQRRLILDNMEFTPEHIISVTHDLMLVSKEELVRFLEYMCGKRLQFVHIAAANDYCVKPLVKQFPWLVKVDSTSLETKRRMLSRSIQNGSGLIDPSISASQISAIALSNAQVLEQYKLHELEWMAKLKKTLGLKPTYEVKTVTQSGFKPWGKEAYTYWWMLQRQRDD